MDIAVLDVILEFVKYILKVLISFTILNKEIVALQNVIYKTYSYVY